MRQIKNWFYLKRLPQFFGISTSTFILLASSALANKEYSSWIAEEPLPFPSISKETVEYPPDIELPTVTPPTTTGSEDKQNSSNSSGPLFPIWLPGMDNVGWTVYYNLYLTTQAAAYSANISAVNRMFMQNNDHNYIDDTSLWLNISHRKLKTHHLDGLVHANDDMSVIQLGTDIFKGSFTEQDNWKIGLTGGYGRADIANKIIYYDPTRTDSKVNGYAGGVYTSWISDAQQGNGAQFSGTVLYSHYRNGIDYFKKSYEHGNVHNSYDEKERYNSSGWIIDAEAQYGADIYKSDETHLLLKPHIQLHLATIKTDAHTDLNGYRMSKCSKGFVATRTGLGLYSNNKLKSDGVTINPFLETDLFTFSDECTLHYSNGKSTAQIEQDKSTTAGQIKLGVTSYLGKDLSFKITLSNLKGSRGYQQREFNLGGIWSF